MPSRVDFSGLRALDRLNRAAGVADSPQFAAAREEVAARRIGGIRERVARGVDSQGRALAPLKPSTLKRRKGTGPILAPRPQSPILNLAAEWSRDGRGFVMAVDFGAHPEVGYLTRGTARMPARDVLTCPKAEFESYAAAFNRAAVAAIRGES